MTSLSLTKRELAWLTHAMKVIENRAAKRTAAGAQFMSTEAMYFPDLIAIATSVRSKLGAA